MRFRPAYPTLLAVALLAVPGTAAAAKAPTVRVTACQTGKDAAHRLATYHAKMRAVPGTARMAIRFQLIERAGAEGPKHAPASGLSAWHLSRAGVKKFGYAQTVKGLSVGAIYRSVVQFRWLDSAGRTIRQQKRTSGACAEDGDLPNLTITAVRISPGSTAGTAVYSVAVGNTGRGAAKDFGVDLIVDGALSDSTTIDRLDGGETKTVKLTGPVCHRLRAVVDGAGTALETIEDDNALRSTC
jgi:hypothetical protein